MVVTFSTKPAARTLLDPDPDLHPRVDWDLERLRKEWKLWNKEERDEYLYWLDLAKECEHEEPNSARFAAYRVLLRRRRVGSGRSAY